MLCWAQSLTPATGGFRESPCLCLRTAPACAHKSHPGPFNSLLLTLTHTSPGISHSQSIGGVWECFSTPLRSRNFKKAQKFGKTLVNLLQVLLSQSNHKIHSCMGESRKSHIDILHLFSLIDISVLADPLQRGSELSLVSATAERIQSKVEHFCYLTVGKE